MNFCFGCVGAVGAPLDTAGRLRTHVLTNAVALVEEQSVKAKEAITKAASTLSSYHRSMFPDAAIPATMDGLVESLCGSSLSDYSQEQTVRGARAAVTLALAGGIQGDFQKAFSEFPKDADGKEVDLKPFARQARKLSKQLNDTLSRRAAAE